MGDELEDVKTSLMQIGNSLANRKPQPDVRFGAVFYRDLADLEVTRVIPLSRDLHAVKNAIMGVRAEGGNDWEEHVGIGLHKALEMDWSHSDKGGVRLIDLVGDAPPHNDYDDGYDVESALSIAKQLGIKIHVIGCSGLGKGEPEMAHIARSSGGTYSEFQRQPHGQHSRGASRSSKEKTFSTGPSVSVSYRSVEKMVSAKPSHSALTRHADHGDRGNVIGIDLGTTFSTVGIYKNGRVEIIRNSFGNPRTQSSVTFSGDGGIIVGGNISTVTAPWNTSTLVFDVKRLIGRHFDSAAVQNDLSLLPYKVIEERGKPVIVAPNGGGTNYTPEEISAFILRKMKVLAEAYLGEEVTRAVITVPAYFSDSQRQATIDAGTIAGLHVLHIINEPTAVAIAYGLNNTVEQNIIVYDLGGGTLDVSVLTIEEGIFEVVATKGNSHLGGKDFDDRITRHLQHVFQSQHGLTLSEEAWSSRSLHQLRVAAIQAKHELSSAHHAAISIEALHAGLHLKTNLSRDFFESLCIDLFSSTLEATQQVLDDSGVRKDQIDEIVLTGGSTQIPKIHQLVKSFFDGKEIKRGISPDEAVAYGAVLQAGTLSREGRSDMLTLDVSPMTLGFADRGGVMVPLIKRNTVIPTKKSMVWSTSYDNQVSINIDVYQGEHPKAADNHFVGTYSVAGLAPAPRGVPQIDVTFEIGSNGIFHCGAQDRGTAKSEKTTMFSDTGRLSEDTIEKMLRHAEAAVGIDDAKTWSANRTTDTRSYRHFVSHEVSVEADTGEGEVDLDEVLAKDDVGEIENIGRLSKMMLESIHHEL